MDDLPKYPLADNGCVAFKIIWSTILRLSLALNFHTDTTVQRTRSLYDDEGLRDKSDEGTHSSRTIIFSSKDTLTLIATALCLSVTFIGAVGYITWPLHRRPTVVL